MSEERRRVQELFAAALEQPTLQRGAFLDRNCANPRERAEVESLLAALDEAPEFLAEVPAPPTDVPGHRIDRYVLRELLGEGGFGTVWCAEQQEPIHRRVALKLLKPGMDSRQVVARFAAERQVLAWMEHPNIARVLDAGTTGGGRPFFVMELVDGVPLGRYCQERALSLRDRVRLLREVCLAVQHAHERGIIHRDLKPTNVLVTEHEGHAVPKVIDFGIAKAIRRVDSEAVTAQRQLVGTLAYMAPEQAEESGDVDLRADVYSLGVMLYELLCGSRPFAAVREPLQFLRRLQVGEIERPSRRLQRADDTDAIAAARGIDARRLLRTLRTDLDWVAMRALERDRVRRYPTAQALADDLDRWLRHRPVDAGPPGLSYRLRKFARRNRVFVGAGAVVLGGLCTGLLLALAGWRDAEAERELAAAAAARAESALEAARELITAADPHAQRGPDYKVRELLDDFAAALERRHDLDPLAEATLRATIGGAYRNLGLPDAAAPHTGRALQLRLDAGGDDDDARERITQSLWDRGWLLHDQGDYAGAADALRQAIATAPTATVEGRVARAAAQSALADVLRHQGRLDEAAQLLDEAVPTLDALPRGALQAAVARNARGMLLLTRRDFAGAEAVFRDALARFRAVAGDDSPTVALALVNLAGSLRGQRRAAEAAPFVQQAVEIRRRVLGSDHPALLHALQLATIILIEAGQPVASIEAGREALAILRRCDTDGTAAALPFRRDLARALELCGDHAAAAGQLLAIEAMLADTPASRDYRHAVTALVRHYEIRQQQDGGEDAGVALARWRQRLEALPLEEDR